MLKANFIGKEIISEQLSSAYIISSQITKGFASIKLRTLVEQRFPSNERVPITMLAYVEDSRGNRPIEFLLHIVGGYIDELEIFDSAGFDIEDYSAIPLDKIEFMILNPKI